MVILDWENGVIVALGDQRGTPNYRGLTLIIFSKEVDAKVPKVLQGRLRRSNLVCALDEEHWTRSLSS